MGKKLPSHLFVKGHLLASQQLPSHSSGLAHNIILFCMPSQASNKFSYEAIKQISYFIMMFFTRTSLEKNHHRKVYSIFALSSETQEVVKL